MSPAESGPPNSQSQAPKEAIDISRTPRQQDQDTGFLGELDLAQKEHIPQTSPILTSVQGQ